MLFNTLQKCPGNWLNNGTIATVKVAQMCTIPYAQENEAVFLDGDTEIDHGKVDIPKIAKCGY